MHTKTINLSIPHRLSPDEARTRIQNTLAGLKSQHAAKLAQVNDRWTGNHMDFRLAVMGQSVSGRVDVGASAVDLAIDLPWILAMFAERVRGEVQREGTKLLE
ncbi:MAG: polyhydroxyalkanoic acid system family protein [Tepidisphaeraceae bacterium]